VRCGTAAAHDVDGLEPEVIQDRREIVSRLTEAPPRQPNRGAEARTLGRNDPQMPLRPRPPISPQRVPASRRSGNPQQRQPRLIAELRPGHDSPAWTLKAQITDALQDRFSHNPES
jgi:hypothetical protein